MEPAAPKIHRCAKQRFTLRLAHARLLILRRAVYLEGLAFAGLQRKFRNERSFLPLPFDAGSQTQSKLPGVEVNTTFLKFNFVGVASIVKRRFAFRAKFHFAANHFE